MATHAGKIEGKSKAARLYRLLRRRPGAEWSTLELARRLNDPCVHTTVHEVRCQLPAGLRIVCAQRQVRGAKRFFYALQVG